MPRRAPVAPGGLPGKVTSTSLRVPTDLSEAKTIAALRLVGDMHAACPWLAADLLIHAEDRFGERVGQIAEALNWAPATVANVIRVGRAIPPSRRRAALPFSVHAEVVSLERAEQDHWLTKAEKGEAGVPWSSRRLRSEMKGLPESAPTEMCPTCGKAGYKAKA